MEAKRKLNGNYSQNACRRSRHKITNLEIPKNQLENRPPLKHLAQPQDHQGTLNRRGHTPGLNGHPIAAVKLLLRPIAPNFRVLSI